MVLARSAWQRRPNPHVAIPIWVKHGIDAWMVAAKIEDRRLLRPLFQEREVDGDELGEWAIWSVVEQSAKEIGIEHFGAHDLRRTCAKLCRKNGGDLEQIEFLLGHRSIQTTERHLGSEQQPITRCTPAQSAAPNSGTNCHHLHSRKTDDRNPNG